MSTLKRKNYGFLIVNQNFLSVLSVLSVVAKSRRRRSGEVKEVKKWSVGTKRKDAKALYAVI